MDIRRYDPWEEFNRLQQRINELFAGFFQDMPHTLRDVSFAPAVDVYRSNDHLVLRIDLPGIVEDDVDIAATETAVVIRGERDHPADAASGGYHQKEWVYGFFERKIDLPARVDPDRLSADYSDGVFVIRLPLAARGDDA